MTTPLPPPPPGQPDWPASRPAQSGAQQGREPWWTGGRIALAVVLVLVLMGGAGFAGFLAGMAVGGTSSFIDELEDSGSIGGSFGGDTPDEADVEGAPVAVGDTLRGTFDGAVVGHPLDIGQETDVTIDLRSEDFDTIVTILDEDGVELASNDDIAFGEDRNSRVELTLPPGSYRILVDAFGFDEGDYELTVR